MNLDTWTATKITTPTGQPVSFHDVAYGTIAGKSAFVAVGPQSTATSEDGGATWTATDRTGIIYYAVAFGHGVFVVVGGHTTSWNGFAWTGAVSQLVGGSGYLRAVAFGGRRGSPLFVAVGDSGMIKVSSDGVSFTAVTSGITDSLQAVAYGKGRFLAATGSTILTSPNGVTWTKQVTTPPMGNLIKTLAFGDGRFMCVDNGLRALTSLDGITWTLKGTMPLGASSVNGLAYAFDMWVASDANGLFYTSPNGLTWTKRPYSPVAPGYVGGLAYGTNRCVAVADGGQVHRSEEYPNAELSDLTCSTGQVTPTFDPLELAYYAQVTQDFATVTPTSQDGATIQVRFDAGREEPVASGMASAVGQLVRRAHKFSITVTARNGFKRIYALDVSK